MSKDSFFSTAESLMGQIMAILEKKYGMDIPEADSNNNVIAPPYNT